MSDLKPELVDEPDDRGRQPLWQRLGRRLVNQVSDALVETRANIGPIDADLGLQAAMAGAIEAARLRYPLDPGAQYQPGQPLKLMFVGYAGTRNTGADVRVEEMVRQFRHLIGDHQADLSILTLDPARTRGYFRTVKQVVLPKVFPAFLAGQVHGQHGVVACEGSMFKSKFANALSTLMVGGLGLALAEHKLAIAYGGEAGGMDPSLEAMVRRYCQGAWVIARNDASVDVLADLGIDALAGTDTAWTFSPAPPAVGEAMLRQAGWDGAQPVLAVAPINPFWWPVKPDLAKRAANLATGAYAHDHYTSLYFHRGGPDVEAAQARYLDGLAQAVHGFRQRHGAFVVLVGMEALDRRPCEQLAARLPGGAPCFISDEHDMFALVSLLRRCRYLVTSRYHAAVCSMPGGTLSIGVTMDERLRNLFADRGTPELCLTVDDPALGAKLGEALDVVAANQDEVAVGIGRTVAKNLLRMGQMGQLLVEHLRAKHPGLNLDPALGLAGDPVAHLPSLSVEAQSLLEQHS